MRPFQLFARMGGTSAAPLWSPLNLTAPATILCDHLSSNTNDGSTVSQWNDRSGNGYHLSQGGGSTKPFYNASALNGYAALGADGGSTGGASGQSISNVSNPPRNMYQSAPEGWMFAVYKLDGTSATQNRAVCYAETTTISSTRLGLFSDSSAGAGVPNMRVRRLDGDSIASLASSGGSINDGNYHMVYCAINWATREGRIYVDGNTPTTNSTLTAATGNTSNTASNRLSAVGANNNVTTLNGKQAVAIFGTTLPSDAEVDKLFGYYAHQLALTANLPAGHPYKTSPP